MPWSGLENVKQTVVETIVNNKNLFLVNSNAEMMSK